MRTKREGHKLWVQLCRKWQEKLWLGRWRISCETRDMTGKPALGERRAGHGAVAESEWNAVYENGTATLNEGNARFGDRHDLDRIACHEMLHLALSPVVHAARQAIDYVPKGRRDAERRAFDEALERVTTHLESVLVWEDRHPRRKR